MALCYGRDRAGPHSIGANFRQYGHDYRDALVKATNGRVGQVAGFLIQPPHGAVTHLMLRRGQLWRTNAEIAQIEKEAVYLKLDKRSFEARPAVPMRRKGL